MSMSRSWQRRLNKLAKEKEPKMNEVSQALQFLAASLIAKDRTIEELQKQVAELQKQVQAAMATSNTTEH